MAKEKKPTTSSKIAEARNRRKSALVVEPAGGGTKTNGELEAAIRARAYEIYEARGRTDGQAQEDWVRAEREVLLQMGKRSA